MGWTIKVGHPDIAWMSHFDPTKIAAMLKRKGLTVTYDQPQSFVACIDCQLLDFCDKACCTATRNLKIKWCSDFEQVHKSEQREVKVIQFDAAIKSKRQRKGRLR